MLDRHYYVQIAPNNSFVGKWLSQQCCHANDITFMVIYKARTDDISQAVVCGIPRQLPFHLCVRLSISIPID